MATSSIPQLHLRKADARYYVSIDGVKIGWVSKNHDGSWTMWATVESNTRGTVMARGYKTRNECLWDGLGHLRIYNLGRIVRYDFDALVEVIHYVDEESLRAIERGLLIKINPFAAEVLAGGAS